MEGVEDWKLTEEEEAWVVLVKEGKEQGELEKLNEEALWETGPALRRGVGPVDLERCRELAGAGCSLEETAAVLKTPPYVIENNLQARYGATWEEYATLARLAKRGELQVKLVEMVKDGNPRLAELYAKRFFGWDLPKRMEWTGRGGGPIEVKALTDKELSDRMERIRITKEPSPLEKLPEGVKVLEGAYDTNSGTLGDGASVRGETEGDQGDVGSESTV